jgi:hypothetical protein
MSETRLISRIPTAKIALTIGAVLIAGPLGGCATLRQPFSAVQPTAALVEPASNSGARASDEVSVDAATASVDSQWTTRVYHGWAGPSSQM